MVQYRDHRKTVLQRCGFFLVWVLLAGFPLGASAQIYKNLVSFNGTDGAQPEYAILSQGRDGNLWGTTQTGGAAGFGTGFRLTPAGVLSYASFDGSGGTQPASGVILGSDNNLYGVTPSGGMNGLGTVFKMSVTGGMSILYSFDGTHGSTPVGSLTLGVDHNLYGVTEGGGSSTNCTGGCGTIFKITLNGILTALHSFDSLHGAAPLAGLTQGNDGNLYGTTSTGGQNGFGTVFRITPSGSFILLFQFDFTNGATPAASLVQGSDGTFYGTTRSGGTGFGCIFYVTLDGTVFTLWNFTGGRDGGTPTAPLVQATDGNLYGTTSHGGLNSCGGGLGCGTVFQIAPSGHPFSTLHAFSGGDGSLPLGPVTQNTNGLFYGTTSAGVTGNGNVFSLDNGLGPFIKTTLNHGVPGWTVQILGTGLTGSTSVTFNGVTAAGFKVLSDTYMTAIVPTGTSTGPIQVTTPGGTLSTNGNFIVGP